jgi:regulator of protease activity HflC (stomatin/prohibitin superfamily)
MPRNVKGIGWIIAAVIIVIIIFSSVVIVSPGYVGVVELLGSVWESPLYNGIHIVIPFANVHKMEIRKQAYTMSGVSREGQLIGDDAIEALTKEGLKVKLDVTSWFHLIGSDAPMVYETIGPDYVDKIVRPALRTAIRDIVARYSAANIYSDMRDSVVSGIYDRAVKLTDGKGVVVEEILLRNVVLPPRLQDEIDSKLAAEQEAQKMEFVLQKEKSEKERKVLEAEGIKQANSIISEGLTSNYIRWYRIEMLKQLVNSPNNTIVILPEDMKTAPMIFGSN